MVRRLGAIGTYLEVNLEAPKIDYSSLVDGGLHKYMPTGRKVPRTDSAWEVEVPCLGNCPLTIHWRTLHNLFASQLSLSLWRFPCAWVDRVRILSLRRLKEDAVLAHKVRFRERERERSTQGDRESFSSVGLWEGFLGVNITLTIWVGAFHFYH